MKTYSFEKVSCSKCGNEYAVPKGTAKAFKCPSKRCVEQTVTNTEEAKK